MISNELSALFAGTTGSITIRERRGTASVTSRDFAYLAMCSDIFDAPMIDLVTDQGEAVGLVVRQPLSAHKPPLPNVWGKHPVRTAFTRP